MPIVTNGLPTTGLVAYYPFDGNANDASGNGNNGTATNTVLTTDRFNQQSAFTFDGVSSSVTVPYNSSFNLDQFTISAWINLADGNYLKAERIIFNKEMIYEMAIIDQTLRFAIQPQGSSWAWIDTGITLPKNEWIHVALKFDSNSLATVYMNGNPVKTAQFTGKLPYTYPNTGGDFFSIARRPGGSLFSGKIDEVRVYNRALSDAEVKQLAGTVVNNTPVITSHSFTLNSAGNVSRISLAFNGTGYLDLERSTDQVNYTRIICNDSSQTKAATNDLQIQLGTTYSYRVRMSTQPVSCSNNTNWSAFSAAYAVVVPKPPTTCTSTLENLGTAKTQNAAVTVEMPNINLCGGIQVNSGARQNKVVQKLSDDVDVSAKLTVNMDSYVGQAADLVVYAAYTPLNSTASLNFMLNESGVPIVWENTLVAFKSNVTLSKTQDISMYKGKFVGTGRLQVYFGFRLKKDGIVIVNSTPIDIMINP
jgi:hypothetical protein